MTDDTTQQASSTDATDDRPDEPAPSATVTDPTALLDRNGVEFRENPPEVHENHFDLYEPIAGIAIVGVVDDDGRVLVLSNGDSVMLPHATVDPGNDFAAVARRAAEERAGVTVDSTEPVRVRRNTYRRSSTDDDRATGHDVVFRASPAAEGTGGETLTTPDDWTVGWYDDLPIEPESSDNDVVADVQLFLDS